MTSMTVPPAASREVPYEVGNSDALTHGGLLVGLMSGTSTDGVDAAAVGLSEVADDPCIELLAFETTPYTKAVRDHLLRLAEGDGGPADVARANFLLGELFSDAAAAVLHTANLRAEDIAAVGCSGHTLAHVPDLGDDMRVPATLQVGEAAVIAERLGVTVVSDFRVRDVAAGGEGAPLVPYFDFRFLRSDAVHRVALNIGGIANVTILRAGSDLADVIAFDTGPGNMPIDIAVRELFPAPAGFDEGGELARSGAVDADLLEWALQHEHFACPPPKSCGREEFGEHFVSTARERAPGIAAEDLVATLTELTARTAGQAIAVFRDQDDAWEIIVSGGGAHNGYLLGRIEQHAQMPVILSDEIGISADAKEAMAFAFLAWETLRRKPANVPSATGAAGPRVLGKITPP